MILVHDKNGAPVKIGEKVTDFRGDKAIVTNWEEPRHPGSTGRIYVKRGDWTHGYFPSVFDCHWMEG